MATVNYLYPVVGSVPSSHATQTANKVVAQVVMTDLDTTATISHNFLSSTIYPPNTVSDLASGFPEVDFNYTTAPTTTLANPIAVTLIGTNAIVLTKIAQIGSAFTGIVIVSRPQTSTR